VKLPGLGKSSSETSVASLQKLPPSIYGKRWTTENKRFLHMRRERRWLQQKAKHRFIDFTLPERAEFRRYFDHLKGPTGLISGEQIEDLLISLGVVNTQDEVAGLIARVDDRKTQQLDFEQFLELITVRTDSKTIAVFRDMLEGKLGDNNLNFQTVLAQYRRQRLLEGSGAGATTPEQQEMGCKVLKNYAELTRSRSQHLKRDPEEEQELKMFDVAEAPLGGMKTMWRGLCTENNLMPSRPSSGRRTERPKSPTEILAPFQHLIQASKRRHSLCKTVVVEAPAFYEGF